MGGRVDVLSWMRRELSNALDDYTDTARCPEYTRLVEAWAIAHDVGPIPDEVWGHAIEAFDPYRATLNE